jgi:hypothetical protein
MAVPTFFIKRNDTSPSLNVALEDDVGRPIDVTGATIVFHMRNSADDSVKISGASATIVSATRGEVRYSFSATDSDTSGNFEAEFQVTFSGGAIETFPNDGYINVIITEDVV